MSAGGQVERYGLSLATDRGACFRRKGQMEEG